MKAIVSVIGKDRTGIIAKVAGALYEMNVNVEDISQTILQDCFTMIMMIKLPEGCTVDAVDGGLQKVAAEMGVEINVRHEDIFNSMHRI